MKNKISQVRTTFTIEEVFAQLKQSQRAEFENLLRDGTIQAEGRYFDPDEWESPERGLPGPVKVIGKTVWRDYWVWIDNLNRQLLYHPDHQGRYLEIEIPLLQIRRLDLKVLERLQTGKRPKKTKGADTRSCELHQAIGQMLANMKAVSGEFPSGHKAWRYIEDNYRTMGCIIDEVVNDTNRVVLNSRAARAQRSGGIFRLREFVVSNINAFYKKFLRIDFKSPSDIRFLFLAATFILYWAFNFSSSAMTEKKDLALPAFTLYPACIRHVT